MLPALRLFDQTSSVNDLMSLVEREFWRSWNQNFPTIKAIEKRLDTKRFPLYNTYIGENEAIIEIAVTGFSKDDINITVDKDIVMIDSNKKEDIEDKTGLQCINRQLTQQALHASWKINDEYNIEELSAKVENGILKIRVPKKEISISTTKKNIQIE